MKLKYLFLIALIYINLYSANVTADAPNFCSYGWSRSVDGTAENVTLYQTFNGGTGTFRNFNVDYSIAQTYTTYPIEKWSDSPYDVVYQTEGQSDIKKYTVAYITQSEGTSSAYHRLVGGWYRFICTEEPEFLCPDEGSSLNHSCDRTCEEIDMITFNFFRTDTNIIVDENGNSEYADHKCVSVISEMDVYAECVNYCTNGGYYEGMPYDTSITNINTFQSNVAPNGLSFTSDPVCICETDPNNGGSTGGTDDGSGDGGSTGGTDDGSGDGSTVDMTATNQKLDSIKSNTNTTNTKLEDIKTKMDTTNQKLDTSNDWLSKIDTVLRDIFSTNEDIKNNTDSTNNKLDIMINDNNSITNFLSSINDKISSFFNDITGFRSDVNSKLDTNNQKLQEIKNNSDLLNTNVGHISETGEHINQNVLGVKDAVGSVEVAVESVNGTIESQKTILEESNTLQSDTNDKLDTSNSLLTDNNLKLDGINNSINDTNNKLDGLNTDLNDALGEVNEHLKNIEDTNKSIDDNLKELKDLEAEEVPDSIGDNLHILDDIMNEFSTFKDNLTNQYESVVELGTNSIDTINGGFTSIFASKTGSVTTCKQSFQVNFSSIGAGTYNLEFDPCYFTSMLEPILRPLFYIVFSISLFSFTFSLFRGIL
jgi:uncharacterized coiled-coil DUF342 family protein